jgi:hypothetical protein
VRNAVFILNVLFHESIDIGGIIYFVRQGDDLRPGAGSMDIFSNFSTIHHGNLS